MRERCICAGSLVNSLAAANQEVPKALMDLASRDNRFRKGLGSTGPAGRGRGRGGAGRGRSQVRTLAWQRCPLTACLSKHNKARGLHGCMQAVSQGGRVTACSHCGPIGTDAGVILTSCCCWSAEKDRSLVSQQVLC